MPRPILEEANIHASIRDKITKNHADIVSEVREAIADNAVVVVGMAMNPNPKRARKALTAAGIKHAYLEYGSYLTMWRRRNALKMWTGWPTFPMVFVRGTLIGGADDTEKLLESGELASMVDEKKKAKGAEKEKAKAAEKEKTKADKKEKATSP